MIRECEIMDLKQFIKNRSFLGTQTSQAPQSLVVLGVSIHPKLSDFVIISRSWSGRALSLGSISEGLSWSPIKNTSSFALMTRQHVPALSTQSIYILVIEWARNSVLFVLKPFGFSVYFSQLRVHIFGEQVPT